MQKTNIHAPATAMLIKRWWRLLIIFLVPLILLPLPLIVGTIQARCAYIVLILTIYWVSEAMPYAVTSLLPLAFFPLSGIIPSDKIGLNYFKDITTLFVGSMMLAHAMEHVKLHRRLALFVLSVVGSSIKWSMAGLMGVTAFLSMWINNSAATSIMIPAAIAIVDELEKHQNSNEEVSIDTTTIEIEKEKSINETSGVSNQRNQSQDNIINHRSISYKNFRQLKAGFLIAVAYSAAIGGLATLVGTGPNIFVKGFVDEYYATGRHEFQISFTNFLLFALPTGVIMLIFCWMWLQILYNYRELLPWIKKHPNQIKSEQHLRNVLKEQYKDLGSLSWQEGTIALLFFVMVVLWLTRDFSSYPGWEIIFQKNFVTDGTVAILIGSLSLILPNKNPLTNEWEYQPILKWDELSKKFPWSVFMLQGAGLAIADGFKASVLSTTIAKFLQFIVGTSDLTIIFVVIVLSAIFTEFTSNLACATILFPILDSIADSAGIHAARLILPCCMAVSLSFMLPIATPPNAMIFSSNNVSIIDLIRVGFGMKIIGIAIVFFSSTILLTPIFRIQSLTQMINNTTSVISG